MTAWLDGTPEPGVLFRAWQLHSGDAVLCDYAGVVDAARSAGAHAGVMGGTFAVIGVALLALPFLALRLERRAALSR